MVWLFENDTVAKDRFTIDIWYERFQYLKWNEKEMR